MPEKNRSYTPRIHLREQQEADRELRRAEGLVKDKLGAIVIHEEVITIVNPDYEGTLEENHSPDKDNYNPDYDIDALPHQLFTHDNVVELHDRSKDRSKDSIPSA